MIPVRLGQGNEKQADLGAREEDMRVYWFLVLLEVSRVYVNRMKQILLGSLASGAISRGVC